MSEHDVTYHSQTLTGCLDPSSQWYTLSNLDQIYAISEVIILSNDQHQHKKKQKTTGLIERLNKNIQLLSICVNV